MNLPHLLYIIIGYLLYALSILIHILVIKKKISYKLINGGRSTSYEAQYKTSITSIIILSIGFIVMFFYHIYPDITKTLFSVIFMGMFTLYWLFGLILQGIVTSFEKKFMIPIVLLGVVSHGMLFLEYFLN